MRTPGNLLDPSTRRLRLMLGAQLLWLAVVCVLGAWWGKLILSQAARIDELEGAAGLVRDFSGGNWFRTQRMLVWESSVFFILLLATSILLFWMYWRDVRRSRGLQAFFASVTHELRTPLTSIRLQAESIADTLPAAGLAGEEEKRLLQRLLDDTLRLEAQVERTLELARVEGGGKLFTRPVPIKPWLDRQVYSWNENYRGRAVLVSDCEDVSIEADAAALQVILRNLVENSVRHCRRERVSIRVSAERMDGWVKVTFADDGTGFSGPVAQLGRIFAKGPGSQGTGVGLYLVKALMTGMGGSVDFGIPASGSQGFEVRLWFRESERDPDQREDQHEDEPDEQDEKGEEARIDG